MKTKQKTKATWELLTAQQQIDVDRLFIRIRELKIIARLRLAEGRKYERSCS